MGRMPARFMLMAVAAVAAAYFLRSKSGVALGPEALAQFGMIFRVALYGAATLVAAGTVRDVGSAVAMGAVVLACGTGFEFIQPGDDAGPDSTGLTFNALGVGIGVAIRVGSLILARRRAEAGLRRYVIDAYDDAQDAEALPEECRDAARRAYRAADPDAADVEIDAALDRWLGQSPSD